jgi:LemA protein
MHQRALLGRSSSPTLDEVGRQTFALRVARRGCGPSRAAHRRCTARITGLTRLILVCLASLALAACGSSDLDRADAQVREAWRLVERCHAQRLAVAAAAVGQARRASGVDRDVLETAAMAIDNVSRLGGGAAATDDPYGFDRFKQAQAELTLALYRLQVAGEQNAALARSAEMRALREELSSGAQRLISARAHYSAAIARYNALATTFPTRVTAWLLGYPARQDLARLRAG